jgi:hypothetical protein
MLIGDSSTELNFYAPPDGGVDSDQICGKIQIVRSVEHIASNKHGTNDEL